MPLMTTSMQGSFLTVLKFLQIYVDMTMTNDDFEQLRSVVKHHVDSDEVDLTGRFACNNYGQADPMKLKIGIFFE